MTHYEQHVGSPSVYDDGGEERGLEDRRSEDDAHSSQGRARTHRGRSSGTRTMTASSPPKST